MQSNINKPVKIQPRLPHAALSCADWADCYQVQVPRADLEAIDAANLMLGHFPLWVRTLMAMRNAIVAPFGIKAATAHSSDNMEMIGIFPVVSKTRSQVILGFDDSHLDFRAVIDVVHEGSYSTVSATTLVFRKVLFGKLYLAAITPFHNLIASTMLAKVGRQQR